MDAKELAAILDGIEYPVRIETSILKQAVKSDLVIVHGSSDDLIEFSGAIVDEAGVNDGGEVLIDREGVIGDFDDVEHNVEQCRKWMERRTNARKIEALWCKESGYSWTYKTDIPHETFEVIEDGGYYCRGIVFALKDAEG